MKLKASCAVALLALVATGALAQQTTVQIRASEVKGISLRQGDFADFASTYQLSNGRYIKFTTHGRRYFASLDNGERTEMTPVSRTEFMTVAGTRVKFIDSGDEVTISNYEKLPTAGLTEINVTLVASR